MSGALKKVALCTTIYPGVEAYLPDWYRSVRAQTDRDFQLWVGLDGIDAGSGGKNHWNTPGGDLDRFKTGRYSSTDPAANHGPGRGSL